ncbi:hypothetical protein DFH09DRAFT_1306042 [Mycena vulgaris]|nr:hypothetical protein DFH09DRAFT_1306042 [Mycena vulgaris]
MTSISRERFASIGSDTTGNTKLGRELAQGVVATVFIVPDPNHHLYNTIKDVCKVAIGKMRKTITHFSHSTYSATHLDKSKLAWFKHLCLFHNFELEIQQFCNILEPIARAIKCLEGLEATVGDIWKFFVAITAVLHDLFKENILSFPSDVQDEVCSIVNRHYDEMINGPNGDLFLVGFCLEPEHVT